MAWKKPSKNYIVAVLTRDPSVLDTLSRYFAEREGVAVVDLLGMEETLARKFVAAFEIDAAFAERAEAERGDSGLLGCILEKTRATDADTQFILRYDGQSALFIKDYCDVLLKQRLLVMPFRIDEAEDCEILAQTVHGMINGAEEKRALRRGMSENR